MSLVRQTTRSLKQGFSTNTLKTAGTILAGNMGATFFAEKAASFFPMLRSHVAIEVAALLGIASAQAVFVKKFIPRMLNANSILVGGILAGVTRGIKAIAPNSFTTCGLGEDMDGLGDFVNPFNIAHSINPHGQYVGIPHPNQFVYGNGFGAFARPDQPMIGTHGIGDHATGLPAGQVLAHGMQPRLIHALDGLANLAVQEEIAQSM